MDNWPEPIGVYSSFRICQNCKQNSIKGCRDAWGVCVLWSLAGISQFSRKETITILRSTENDIQNFRWFFVCNLFDHWLRFANKKYSFIFKDIAQHQLQKLIQLFKFEGENIFCATWGVIPFSEWLNQVLIHVSVYSNMQVLHSSEVDPVELLIACPLRTPCQSQPGLPDDCVQLFRHMRRDDQ